MTPPRLGGRTCETRPIAVFRVSVKLPLMSTSSPKRRAARALKSDSFLTCVEISVCRNPRDVRHVTNSLFRVRRSRESRPPVILITASQNLLIDLRYSPSVMRQPQILVRESGGCARVLTSQQSIAWQQADILAAGVWRDDLYVDHGISGARASRTQFDRALAALEAGDTLVITTLDRLGRSTQNGS